MKKIKPINKLDSSKAKILCFNIYKKFKNTKRKKFYFFQNLLE